MRFTDWTVILWKVVQTMNCDKKHMRLYAVTDRTWLNGQTLAAQVGAALRGGVTCVQLREKDLDAAAFLKEAFEIKDLCRQYNVPFIINDNVDIAIKCGADGVHVGQHDMQAADVRCRIGNNMILGVSAQTVSQAVLAEKNGADYLGVGAVFTTTTKLDANAVNHETVRNICKAVSIPIVAIGGISQDNLMQLAGTGVDGVALVSAIFSSSDIESTCRTLRALSERMVTG
jgi:thiamine-phosphate pyrophosphorylase